MSAPSSGGCVMLSQESYWKRGDATSLVCSCNYTVYRSVTESLENYCSNVQDNANTTTSVPPWTPASLYVFQMSVFLCSKLAGNQSPMNCFLINELPRLRGHSTGCRTRLKLGLNYLFDIDQKRVSFILLLALLKHSDRRCPQIDPWAACAIFYIVNVFNRHLSG